ncbi:MAG: lipopolysaccharide assembly protein LapA domain-containing protein [Burkholderiaceae bacterium]|jgi:putative membrane protein|nr:lipopolysaccharide assembly protein LapA domain-containing protein [Burkholderiaceae bacterium]MDH5208430.1 lipopolysaccharide assembly protein LapA domain-containing protein [Burkholderiaceae bacterium]
MRLLAWVVKLGFFLLVLWFALKNTTPVPVRFSADFTLDRVPLIVVMLVCVALGALLGALALALPVYRTRRELTRLRATLPVMREPDAVAERDLSAARQSGAVAELGTGDRE